MKIFFDRYIDIFTLALAVLISILVALKTWNQSGKKTRLGILPLLYFAPVLITACMFSHLFEVTYHAIETRFTGSFSYGFYLYSLYLMPLVIGYLSLIYWRETRLFCLSANANKLALLKAAGLIALITLPAVKISPIAALPSIVSVISIFASLFVHKRREITLG